MTITVADLVARLRADTSDLERGTQVAKQQLQSVEQQAGQTARALEIMAQQASKAGTFAGSSVPDILRIFQQGNVQPTAAAMAEAAKQMQNTTAAAVAAVQPTRTLAQAAQATSEGFKMSETSLARFGATLIGINLTFSLMAAAGRTLHDAIAGIVENQLAWEQSVTQVRAIYGQLAPQIIAVSQAQAQAPGLLGSQQEFLQANAAAGYLTRRYGIAPGLITGLTSAGGAASFAYGYDPQQRASLQARLLQFATTGAGDLSDIGALTDPLSVARTIGLRSEAGLQGIAPQDLDRIRALMGTVAARRASLDQNTPALLAAQRNLQQLQARAAGGATNVVESGLFGNAQYGVSELGQYYERSTGAPVSAQQALSSDVDTARKALQDNEQALSDNTKALADAQAELAKFGVEANTATARLLSFTGNLEDRYSIARGDIAAQAQGAVAARAQMAIPAFGRTQGEIVATATNTAYQNAYQNYVAQQAQADQDNAIREHLQGIVQYGSASQRPAAARALQQAQQAQPIQTRIGEAQQVGALVDLQTAQTQANLEQIQLTQRERYVQLLRDTVDLRRLDVQQQQRGVEANQMLIRAQQSALPAQYALSNAQYQGNLAQALANQRLGRTLQGRDVSGLPSIDELIQMNVQSQFAVAEAGPAALQGQRQVELAQRTSTAAGLGQQLTAGQLQLGQLGVDLQNLGDLPTQTALMLEGIQNDRDSLAIQKEQRDLMKDLVRIATGRSPSNTSDQGIQDIANRVGAMVFGDGGSNLDLPAPSDQPGARRGPF